MLTPKIHRLINIINVNIFYNLGQSSNKKNVESEASKPAGGKKLLNIFKKNLRIKIMILVEYTITTKTGDKIGSGTNANVFIIIYGDKLKTDKIQLKKENGDPFERKQSDVFKVNGLDVGEVKKINLSHDGKSIGDGWYIDTVTIVANGKTTEFKCDRWLDIGENDNKTSADFLPGKIYLIYIESLTSKEEVL